ncbi:hypothetical protein EIN_130340 [Entamoeba invadens IP1]|uniref:CXXC-rich protein n=1 Tax=Entamoeba invadens IP1 TaxID=370355 RepID=A0A0A1UFZ6_ENTIV|nr:hypothetical protein EIN_130340 [Entamoeba invadens IP1]ELP94305.1 hypothetical protein EIN_130340 [Entamoeba invadens IP1]|eukprot:XP_004261076.1 hypothetical protein EIN_130340 [Entamoeba invadens IP1]
MFIFFISLVSSCEINAYSKNGNCTLCDVNCADQCVNEIGCTLCKDSYKVSNGKCVERLLSIRLTTFQNTRCSSVECPYCEKSYCNGTACSSCVVGYYVNKGKCSKCDIHCNQCSQTLGCMSCIHGYSVLNMKCTKNKLDDGDYVLIAVGSFCVALLLVGIAHKPIGMLFNYITKKKDSLPI